ncbi:hypothetical protein, partial [Bellilinea sp.]
MSAYRVSLWGRGAMIATDAALGLMSTVFLFGEGGIFFWVAWAHSESSEPKSLFESEKRSPILLSPLAERIMREMERKRQACQGTLRKPSPFPRKAGLPDLLTFPLAKRIFDWAAEVASTPAAQQFISAGGKRELERSSPAAGPVYLVTTGR